MILFLSAFLVGLNLFDAFATLKFLREWEGVYEGNAIMARALAFSPAAFVGVKMLLILASLGFFWTLGRRYARPCLSACCAFYAFVCAYHLWIWSL